MVQLRLKDADARTQVEVARALVAALPSGVPLIMNDRADLAIASGAAGVHVGPEDLPVVAARAFSDRIALWDARLATMRRRWTRACADYVGIGPVYATASKGDAGRGDRRRESSSGSLALCARPAVGVGGIDASNAAAVIAAGARGVAVIRALFSASDPEAAARSLRSAIGR